MELWGMPKLESIDNEKTKRMKYRTSEQLQCVLDTVSSRRQTNEEKDRKLGLLFDARACQSQATLFRITTMARGTNYRT
jgi:hypothetical protein